MARFNLKSKKQDPALIYCILRIRGERFVYSTGLKVPVRYWDVKRGRVKSPHLYRPGKHINAVLDNMEEACDVFQVRAIEKRGWNFDELREELDRITLRSTTTTTQLGAYIEASAKRRALKNKASTVQRYFILLAHLKEAGLDKTTLSRMDRAALHRFDEYMERAGLAHNTRASLQRFLRSFLVEAERDGHEVHPAYKNPTGRLSFRQADSVYLTEEELEKLKAWKGEEHMERVRDTFIVACRTGLRWSDWAKIRTENIRQVAGVYVLRVETEKTGETVDIPVHPDVQRILGDLGGELPKYTNPYFNRAIKDVCAAAGLSKAKKVSTHTARRTFCTTLFLAGVPTLAIARMSGHRTERAFLTYIRMSGEENAVQAGKHGFFGK